MTDFQLIVLGVACTFFMYPRFDNWSERLIAGLGLAWIVTIVLSVLIAHPILIHRR